jgi:hypothetical protein
MRLMTVRYLCHFIFFSAVTLLITQTNMWCS